MKDDIDTTYPRLTYTIKLGYDMMTVRGETGDQMKDGAKDLAEVAGDLASAGIALKNAFGITEKVMQEATASEGTVSPQRRNAARTVKPGAASSGGTCQHGKPWNDCLGKKTKSGQPYKYRWYNSCRNDDCEPWGSQDA